MATAEVQRPVDPSPAEPAPAALPDYLTDPNATLKDLDSAWRYGRPPDYTNTRKVWRESKHMDHEAASLPQLVENLVKNWEVEASFKTDLKDWRTIDPDNYTFAINGGPPQSGKHMLNVGTYNAIIAPNEYYSPEHSDFASSHKTFKRMMPTFAWEVLEVYSGPPTVSFRWRHWGVMKNDYVGFNDKGEKVTVKAHGGPIDIQGVTVAEVDDKVRLQKVNTWFDPLDMFRQMAPNGIVNKQPVDRKVDATPSDLLDEQGEEKAAVPRTTPAVPLTDDKLRDSGIAAAAGSACPFASTGAEIPAAHPPVQQSDGAPSTEEPKSIYTSSVTGHLELSARDDSTKQQLQDAETRHLDSAPYPHLHDMEEKVHPGPGEAVAVPEARETRAELSKVTEGEEESVMNVE